MNLLQFQLTNITNNLHKKFSFGRVFATRKSEYGLVIKSVEPLFMNYLKKLR